MAPESSTADVTPVGQSLSMTNRSSISLSPIMYSRLQEVADMQNSNDRLATLIEAMRLSQNENDRLSAIVQSLKEASDREKCNIKSFYELQLQEVRNQIAELSTEKADLAIDVQRLFLEKDELKDQYESKCKETQIAEEVARMYKEKYIETVADRKKSLVKTKAIKFDLNKLRKQVDDYHTKLGNETKTRVDLENTVRALREEIELKDQIHREELHNSSLIIPISRDHADQYNVSDELQQLRLHYVDQLLLNRSEMESSFDTMMKNELDSFKRENKSLKIALSSLRDRMDASNVRIDQLEQHNSSLKARNHMLQLSLDEQVALTIQSEEEMSRLREENKQQSEMFQDWVDMTITTNVERAAREKLLRRGENFLKIKSPTKRSRNEFEIVNDYAVTSSSSGSIEILESDAAETFIKLHNKGDMDLSLNGWQLIRIAGGNEIVHKFDCCDKISAGADLIIWSADNNDSASVGDISLNSQNWIFAGEMKTTLVNGAGNVEATVERIQKQRYRQIRQQIGDACKKCILM